MWRAFFLAIGTMLIIVGIECLLIDSAVLAAVRPAPVQRVNQSWFQTPPAASVNQSRTVRPPKWIPWSLIASGAVVVLYAVTLPRRMATKSE